MWSYLPNRCRYGAFDLKNLGELLTTSGVPQGYNLGLLLFFFYFSYSFMLPPQTFFADNTKLYLEIKYIICLD